MKYSCYIAESKDGFIAKKNGDTTWLHKYNEPGLGWEEFYNSTDIVIMGKATYDVIKGFTSNNWPYEGKRTIVLSHKKFYDKDVETWANGIKELDYKLQGKYKKAFVVGGAKVLHEYVMADLLDDLIITIVPEKIVSGIKLFQDPEEDLAHFDLKETKEVGKLKMQFYESKYADHDEKKA